MNLDSSFLEQSRFVLDKENEETKIKVMLILSSYFPNDKEVDTEKAYTFIWVYKNKLWYNNYGYTRWDSFKLVDHNQLLQKG